MRENYFKKEGDSDGPVICGEYQYGLNSHHVYIGTEKHHHVPLCGDRVTEDEY